MKELEIGITPDFPLRSRHLFEESHEDIMRYSVRRKSYWLLSVEAARYYCIAAPSGSDQSEYAPECWLMRQWIATRRI